MEEVSLLTRKGYLTISLTNSKEGRILLRRHEGIREWFNTLKVGLPGYSKEIISDCVCSVQGVGEQSQAGSLPAGPEEQQSQCGGLATGEEISGRK